MHRFRNESISGGTNAVLSWFLLFLSCTRLNATATITTKRKKKQNNNNDSLVNHMTVTRDKNHVTDKLLNRDGMRRKEYYQQTLTSIKFKLCFSFINIQSKN
uniref:Secreted protein n=1 Tax=Glossina brevipalpis TaxID=37001 RepID=A0A1A9WF01_9MUSC